MTPTENIINKWAKNLTKTIIETRYFDAKEIESQLKIQMTLAMRETLGIQLTNIEKNINTLKAEINQGGSKQLQLQGELIQVKAQKTAYARLNANVNNIIANDRKQDIVRKAYTYIYEHFGKEEVEKFKQTLEQSC